MLLEEWRDTEHSFADLGDVAAVQRKMPRRVKRKRPISAEDGTPAGYEVSF
jgi:crooked neck